MSDPAIQALAHALADAKPQSVLAVGRLAEVFVARRFADGPRSVTVAPAAAGEALNRHGRFDLAILTDALESLDRGEASGLLARLRDLYAGCVVLLVSHTDCDWSGTDLTALGFTRLHEIPGRGTLYGFDIATYKTTPDWLNPDYWANPELWDRYRW